MWRTIPFDHPPLTETTRIPNPTTLTLTRGLARPNGNWDSQEQALFGHELSRIHHELTINIYRLIVFHHLIAKKAQPPATPLFCVNNVHSTFYIVHCTLYIEKRSKPVGLLSSAFRFWIMFFLIAEAADGISVDLAAAIPVHAHGVVVQVAGPHVGAALLSRRPEVGVVASAEELVVPAACRNYCNRSNMARFRSYWNRHRECSRHSRISWCEGSRASSTGRRFAP